LLLASVLLVLAPFYLGAVDPPKTDEDLRRENAIADFERRMREADYPVLFDKAAAEFEVPSDVLKGIAFAETRWEHLTWPAGETVSPENGMPRPYGIMSLWDNEFFGHSLLDAAKQIGKTPEELKESPLQNIRGAAALLKKLYQENPKPAGTTETDVESWRNAIVKYCGIPEPDLSSRHALDVYEFMNDGYNQFGIVWEGRPVNLEPMRREVARIVSEERNKNEKRAKVDPLVRNAPLSSNQQPMLAAVRVVSTAGAASAVIPLNQGSVWRFGLLLLFVAIGSFGIFTLLQKRKANKKRK
jgi:hypothetical protein